MALASLTSIALGAPTPGVTGSVPTYLTPRDSTVDGRRPLDPYEDSEAQKLGPIPPNMVVVLFDGG